MEHITDVLVRRDGISEEEAERQVADFREEIDDMIMDGDLEGIEDALMDDFGLEPDYLMDILF